MPQAKMKKQKSTQLSQGVSPKKQTPKQNYSKITLNASNYYDIATSWQYLSVSLFKDFQKCEAAALAKLKEEWEPRSSPTALLVGNYLHSYFESSEAHQAFIEANHDALTLRNGKTLRADYRQADKMIATLDNDQRFQALYQGDKEVIVTGEIDGQLWKGKIDCLNLDGGYFVDLKTTRDIDQQIWSTTDRRRYGFIKSYGYYYQMAMYQLLIEQTFGIKCWPFIVGVSKQDPPAKRAFNFSDVDDQYALQEALDDIKDYQPRIAKIMNGEVKPKRCGTCEYCRQTAQLELVNASSLND